MRTLPLIAVLLIALGTPRADATVAPVFKTPSAKSKKVDQVVSPPPRVFVGSTTVVLAWDGARATTTIVPTARGDTRKFTLLVPVFGKVKREDVKLLKSDVHFELLHETMPVVEEARDFDPCVPPPGVDAMADDPHTTVERVEYLRQVDRRFLGGGYDISLLPARDAKSLARWVKRSRLDVGDEAAAGLAAHLAAGDRVLVVRANLTRMAQNDLSSLRPLQIRTRTKELPRLPLAAAAGFGARNQLVVMTLGPEATRPTSHKALRMPAGAELPASLRADFAATYEDFIHHQLSEPGEPVAMLEFAGPAPIFRLATLGAKPGAFLTRWRLQLDERSPDLELEAAPRELYRSNFILHRPWHPLGNPSCKLGRSYLRRLSARLEGQARVLEDLSGTTTSKTMARFRLDYPKGFRKWKEPKKELKVLAEPEDEEKEPTLMDQWWKLAAGLLIFVVGLIVIGRIRRG